MSLIRKVLIAAKGDRVFRYPSMTLSTDSGSAVQEYIIQALKSDLPCMIARFGSVELKAVVDFLYPPSLSNAVKFIKGQIPSFGYAPSTIRTMHVNAGLFPAKESMLDRFGQLMLECMPLVDILGSWRPEEAEVLSYIPNALRVPLYTLEPYYFDNPWTIALEGKRVLVIHPFEESIRKQHEKGRYGCLFADPRLSPNYELITLKAVQSIAGNKPVEFDDWFQALDWMREQIDKVSFDVAIIGCGAYGFPLAAYVKQIGRKAVHLGGAVQNLFGIKSAGIEKDKELSKIHIGYGHLRKRHRLTITWLRMVCTGK